MRKSWTPSIVPNSHDETVYLVLDDFGRNGRAWREADVERTDLETVIGDLLTGRGRIHKGFFGLVAISTVHGLMDVSAEEAQTKQFMAKACDQVYGVFDSSKVGGFGLHSFAAVSEIDGLFTDDGIEPNVVADWAERGVSVHLAPGVPDRSAGRRAGPR